MFLFRLSRFTTNCGHLIFCGIFVAVLVAWAYAPSLTGPFLFDDIFQIENNPALDTLWPPLEPMFGGPRFPKRPLAYYSFALNKVLGGPHPFGYRLVNLVIHLVNGLLVWQTGTAVLKLLAAREERDCRGKGDRLPSSAALIAGSAAAIWLVHPLCSQPVAYIYQRMELLAAMAILGAVLCFLKSMESRYAGVWQSAAVAASALGMLMKETAVAAPAVILLIDALAVHRQSSGLFSGVAESLRRRPSFYAAVFATIGIAVAVVWGQRQEYPELANGSWTPLEYAATQPLALLRYLQLTFWPVGQCFDYGWRALEPGLVTASGAAAAAASVAVAIAASRRLPGLSLAVLVFLVLLAPTSSLLPVLDLAVEHRMYLPLSVIVLAVVGLASKLAARPLTWSPPLAAGVVLGGLLVAVIVGLAMATHQRVQVYRSLFALWDDTADKAPRNPRAHLWRGIALAEQNRQQEAFASFGQAIAIAPRAAETAKAHAWRAAILGRAGDAAGAYAEAERATKLNPREPLGWANLAQACAALGQIEQAFVAGKQALELDPSLLPTRGLVKKLESAAQR